MWKPPPERQNEIQFHLAKRLSYRARMVWAFGLIVAGITFQVAMLESLIWPLGVFLVLAGVLLLLTKGYRNRVETSKEASDWQPVTRKELERIIEVNEQQKKWDQSLVDITNKVGCIFFFLLLGAGITLTMVMLAFSFALALLFAMNAVILFLPFWVTGSRFILQNHDLVVKTRILLELEKTFQKDIRRDGEEFQFQLQSVGAKKSEGELPSDVKAVLLFPGGPASFLGVQMQVSINQVQGTSYPYFYCVLVARKDFHLLEKKWLPLPEKVIHEPGQEADVDILVIRQKTTRKSGYCTKPKVIRTIFTHALEQARAALAE